MASAIVVSPFASNSYYSTMLTIEWFDYIIEVSWGMVALAVASIALLCAAIVWGIVKLARR